MCSDLAERPLGRRTILKGLGAGITAFASAGLANPAWAKMRDDDLCWMSAADLLTLFRERKLSPVEVLKAQIARPSGSTLWSIVSPIRISIAQWRRRANRKRAG